MYYRLRKIAASSAYFCLLWLTWRWFHHGLDLTLGAGSLLVSGMWLVLTLLDRRHLLRTYFDTLSRLQLLVPLMIGVTLSTVSMFTADAPPLQILAGATLGLWGYIYWTYRKNRQQYIRVGHGPLPKGAWINPPAQSLQPGDLLLTSGRMATRLHESVGHGEIVIRDSKGRLRSFSSYMEKGRIINSLRVVASPQLLHGHYIVLRMVKPLSEDEINLMGVLAERMLRQNREWKILRGAMRQRLIMRLPLPLALRRFLVKKTKVTGYDWPGLFLGRRAQNRWTCIGACLELLWRMSITTKQYGTGLMGLGTGLFDPIMPVRFLDDPTFRLLTEDDQKAYEAAHPHTDEPNQPNQPNQEAKAAE